VPPTASGVATMFVGGTIEVKTDENSKDPNTQFEHDEQTN